jgi:hypothetical protein
LALDDEREDLAGDVSFQGPDGVEFGAPFGHASDDVGFGLWIGSEAADGDDAQRAWRASCAAEERLKSRKEKSASLMAEPESWMREAQRRRCCAPSSPSALPPPRPSTTCSNAGTASSAFSRTAGIRLANNAAERAIRPLALGRKSRLFAAGPRRRKRGRDARPDRRRQAQWRRSSSPARRRPQTHRGAPAQKLDESPPRNWKTERMTKAA